MTDQLIKFAVCALWHECRPDGSFTPLRSTCIMCKQAIGYDPLNAHTYEQGGFSLICPHCYMKFENPEVIGSIVAGQYYSSINKAREAAKALGQRDNES